MSDKERKLHHMNSLEILTNPSIIYEFGKEDEFLLLQPALSSVSVTNLSMKV